MIDRIYSEYCNKRAENPGLPWMWILTGVLIYLKTTGKINWPWIVVLLPALIPLTFGVACLIAFIWGCIWLSQFPL